MVATEVTRHLGFLARARMRWREVVLVVLRLRRIHIHLLPPPLLWQSAGESQSPPHRRSVLLAWRGGAMGGGRQTDDLA